MSGARIALPCGLAVGFALAAFAIAPHAIESASLLAAQDDPAELADRAVARAFDAAVAAREIDAALAANDVDLANSFLELARDQNVPLDPALADRVELANAHAATGLRSLKSFGRGLVSGEPEDIAGLAGTAVGDLFLFGDIRDAVREGTRFATGRQADELILGLACVGLAVTAGTYVSVGLATPARVGLTVVKVARRTGGIGSHLASSIGQSLRQTIDWTMLRRAAGEASIIAPSAAVRSVREAVKVEKAEGLMRLVGDVGRVQSKAGTRTALDALRIAESPRDMSRLARLAAAKGGKTRAILKLAGRAAFVLTVGAFNLATWLLSALLTIFGVLASLKRMAERITERYCARRRRSRLRALRLA